MILIRGILTNLNTVTQQYRDIVLSTAEFYCKVTRNVGTEYFTSVGRESEYFSSN